MIKDRIKNFYRREFSAEFLVKILGGGIVTAIILSTFIPIILSLLFLGYVRYDYPLVGGITSVIVSISFIPIFFLLFRQLHKIKEPLKENTEFQFLESIYKMVSEGTNDMVFWMDPQDKLQYISPSCKNITGCSSDDFIKNPGLFWKIIHPEDLEIFLKQMHRQDTEIHPIEFEYRIIKKDGSVCWQNQVIMRFFDSDGNYLGFCGETHDITKFKNKETDYFNANKRISLFLDFYLNELAVSESNLFDSCMHRIIEITESKTGMLFLASGDKKNCILHSWNNQAFPDSKKNDIKEYSNHKIIKWFDDKQINQPVIFNEMGEFKKQIGLPEGHSPVKCVLCIPVEADEKLKAFFIIGKNSGYSEEYDVLYVNLIIKALQGKVVKNTLQKKSNDNEVRFQSIFENSIDAIAVFKNGIHILVNRKYLSLYGYPAASELIGDSSLKLIAVREQNRIEEIIKLRSSGNIVPTMYETVGLRKDKTEFILDVHASTFIMDGELYVITIERDITERKRTEDLLVANQMQLTLAMDIAGFVYWEYDLEKGNFLFNDRFYEMHGTSVLEEGGYIINGEEFIKKYVHPEETGIILNYINHALISEEPYYSRKFSSRIILKNGEIRHMQFNFGVLKDSNGKALKAYGTTQDITEYKKTEEKIKKKINYLHLLNKVIKTFDGKLEIKKILKKIYDEIPRHLDIERVSILLYDEKNNYLISDQLIGIPRDGYVSAPQDLDYSISGKCFSEMRIIIEEDCQNTKLIPVEYVNELNLKSVIAIPIVAENNPLGVLRLDYTTKYHAFSEDEIEFCQLLGEQLGLLIRNAQLFTIEKELEEKYKTIYEGSHNAIVLMINDKITDCNQKMLNLFGFDKKEELLDLSLSELSPEIQPDDMISSIGIQDNIKKVFEKGYKRFEWIFRKKNGEQFYSDIMISAFKTGNQIVLGASIRDITKLKKNEEEIRSLNLGLERKIAERTEELEAALNRLEESNRNLQLLSQAIEYSPFSVMITDYNRNIEYVNQCFISNMGYLKEELIGQKPSILKSGKHSPEYYSEMLGTIISGKQWNGEIYNKKKTGECFWYSMSIAPVKGSDNKISHFVSVLKDISETKQFIQELEEARTNADIANRAKSQFLANMSHEIRTPMNAIIGMINLILKTNLTKKQLNYLAKIDNASNSLLNIIKDILDFSKIEAGKLILESITFDIEKVVEKAVSLFINQSIEKGLDIVYSIDPAVPKYLIGDPTRIEQVLINICGNAIKFTQKGLVLISIDILSEKDNLCELRFTIKDTGIGMTEEQIDRLFLPFSQADASITRRYGGTGLGLAICKNLITLMGGEISVESESSKGSKFLFTLRLEVSDKSSHIRTIVSDENNEFNILICNENKDLCKAYERMLASFGFRSSDVNDLSEAVKVIEAEQEQPYQLLIVDFQIQERTGMSLFKTILENEMIKIKPKIILIINNQEQEEINEKANKIGISSVLIKPVSKSVLINEVLRIVGKEVKKFIPVYQKSENRELSINKIKGARILLVEDNDTNQEVASEILQSEEILVEVANNGEEALVKIKNAGSPDYYDLILMDLHMPVMDGYTTTKIIRSQKEFSGLPIIALSADALVGIEQQVIEAGMNDMILKPINMERLYQILISYIKPREQPQQKGMVKNKEEDIPQEFSVLKGFDYVSGLKRVVWNINLYTNLLIRFYKENQNLAVQIKKIVSGGDIAEALRLIHILKSVAGNLGAYELYKAGAALEMELENNAVFNFETYMFQFESKLEIVLNSIAKYKIKKEGRMETVNAKTQISSKDFVRLIEDLLHLLKESDIGALKLYSQILDTTNAQLYNYELEQISDSINNFDFAQTIKLVKILYEKMEK